MGIAPEFSKKTIAELAKRAAQTCSNPICRKPTSQAHTDPGRSVILGEAAHIRGARPGSARYYEAMTDEQRAAPLNGVWLCCQCAKLIDSDRESFPVGLLEDWKTGHEAWVKAGRPVRQGAVREISVKDGGIGSMIQNEGSGHALHIEAGPGQTAERIEVVGQGIGEIISNTGPGTAKFVRSIGSSAAESSVTVNRPVRLAAGLISKVVVLVCRHCATQFTATIAIQGFAGDAEPAISVKCPACGEANSV